MLISLERGIFPDRTRCTVRHPDATRGLLADCGHIRLPSPLSAPNSSSRRALSSPSGLCAAPEAASRWRRSSGAHPTRWRGYAGLTLPWALCVTTGEVGPPDHRNHRAPVPPPVIWRRFFAPAVHASRSSSKAIVDQRFVTCPRSQPRPPNCSDWPAPAPCGRATSMRRASRSEAGGRVREWPRARAGRRDEDHRGRPRPWPTVSGTAGTSAWKSRWPRRPGLGGPPALPGGPGVRLERPPGGR